MCAYLGVRNVSFSENFANVLNEWYPTQFFPMFPFNSFETILKFFGFLFSRTSKGNIEEKKNVLIEKSYWKLQFGLIKNWDVSYLGLVITLTISHSGECIDKLCSGGISSGTDEFGTEAERGVPLKITIKPS